MPSNYYRCPTCGTLHLITYRLRDVGGDGWPPICGAVPPAEATYWGLCRGVLEIAPQPGDFAMDARSDGGTGKGFQKFSVDVDGHPVEIDSLHKLRTIERESEQRYRNGEGEPLRFRAWTQEASNMGVSAFGDRGKIGDQVYDSGTPHTKSEKVSVRRHGETKPSIPLGPGMRRAKTALKG